MKMEAGIEMRIDNEFCARHIGLSDDDIKKMLSVVGETSLDSLTGSIIPESIKRASSMTLPAALNEAAALAEIKQIASQNQVFKSYIGQGYYGTYIPSVILRNVLENPAWYTAYTPYQAEISQGRLEALLNFQTMVCDLTALPIANSSMLDEATSCAEAVMLAKRSVKAKSNTVLVSQDCHSQLIDVVKTRAKPLGIKVEVLPCSDTWKKALETHDYFAVIASYPATHGHIDDLREQVATVHAKNAAFIVAADLLALTLLTPPGEWGADMVVGSTQRFGVPMGNGGPHAAFLACKDEFKRSLPGRLVGVSVDANGNKAYRLALQTREQHIRREKATSNICTAQVLPAVLASMYAVYHGPNGLKNMAHRVASLTHCLATNLKNLDVEVLNTSAFDTLKIKTATQTAAIVARALAQKINFRLIDEHTLGVSLDETTTLDDVAQLLSIFSAQEVQVGGLHVNAQGHLLPPALVRTTPYLSHPVFNTHHNETSMMRYLRKLSDKDLSLDRSMIPLGSCTMKLNAASEMIPITWPEFGQIHPFAPAAQKGGYATIERDLCSWLGSITGYKGIGLQPNAGSQGEFAGLLAITAYHAAQGQSQRKICLIPSSAHGTNPASAQMVGLSVVVTRCDENGNIDLQDIKDKCEQYSDSLACVMITYPSTHGVYEVQVKELCDAVHKHGGRVYIDGANMNALVGLAAPGLFGGDVSHLNLHKTFCIPHGGGGPGVGPVCVVEDLIPYLPGHPTTQGRDTETDAGAVGPVCGAALGNASVLPISWMYIRMMGEGGLKHATQTAILSANYISKRLAPYYPTLYASSNGHVAHECILDLRGFKDTCAVMAEDVAKRLMDYGFHAPTLSFPVPNTLMVEPTESEPLSEIERFIEALISIRQEISKVESGEWPRDDNPLKNAPHTAISLLTSEWTHPYERSLAAFPCSSLDSSKYWPVVGRIDNVYGDRNLFCTCLPTSELSELSENAE